MNETPVDTEKIHRWFAVECNNRAWDLLENKRTAEEDLELVHIAHASAHHWAKGGNVLNHARAECVVANAHAALGDGSAAMRHAKLCLQLNEANGDDCTDWDRAFAADALARATAAIGDADGAAELKAKARELGDAIAEAGNKQVFDAWFNTETEPS